MGEVIGPLGRETLVKPTAMPSMGNDSGISAYMTPDPEHLELGNPIAYLLNRMSTGDFRHLPVTSNGALVGIISIGDVVRAVHSEMKWMTKVLHDQVVTSAGWATDDEV